MDYPGSSQNSPVFVTVGLLHAHSHTHKRTYIAHQDSTALLSDHGFQLNNSSSCSAIAIPVYMHDVKAGEHDQCSVAAFLFFPLYKK